VSERSPNPPRALERNLRRKLNPSRPAATEERVTNTHVAGGRNLILAIAHLTTVGAIKSEPTLAVRRLPGKGRMRQI
jgi:hypothetical protein